jgi:hypothetical protein
MSGFRPMSQYETSDLHGSKSAGEWQLWFVKKRNSPALSWGKPRQGPARNFGSRS